MHDALYQARILDHYKYPRNKRILRSADVERVASNPSCGDTLTLYLRMKSKTLEEVTYEGDGCAISLAAASMLSERLAGKTMAEVGALREQDVYDLLGVEVSVSRKKCALLALRALQEGLASWAANNNAK